MKPPARPFSLLARVYDAIMDDVEYEDWGEFILDMVRSMGWHGHRVLDLGCGTGNSCFPFVARGFEVVGVDGSEEMLAVARDKLPNVRFVRGEFTTFQLGESFDLVISMFDSLNNLLEPADFLATLERIYNHLTPGGIVMFDVNTTVGLRDLWEESRAEGWSQEVYYRWEHSFDDATGLAQVVAYCADDQHAFTEVHTERAYDPSEIRDMLSEAGFAVVHVLSYPSGRDADEDEARVWAVGQKLF